MWLSIWAFFVSNLLLPWSKNDAVAIMACETCLQELELYADDAVGSEQHESGWRVHLGDDVNNKNVVQLISSCCSSDKKARNHIMFQFPFALWNEALSAEHSEMFSTGLEDKCYRWQKTAHNNTRLPNIFPETGMITESATPTNDSPKLSWTGVGFLHSSQSWTHKSTCTVISKNHNVSSQFYFYSFILDSRTKVLLRLIHS